MLIKTWDYDYHLRERFDWIITTIILFLITSAIIAFAIFIADVKNFFFNLKETSFVFALIFVIYLFSSLITLLINKGVYHYHYVLYDDELVIINGGKEMVLFDHDTIKNQRIGNHIQLSKITSIKLIKTKDEIRIKGTLINTSIYVGKNDILEVYNYIKSKCL